VGAPWSTIQVNAEWIADHLVWRLAEKGQNLEFDSALFDEVFQTLNANLHGAEFKYVVVAPLFGLKAESLPIRLVSESLPIGVMPTMEIDKLGDSEIVRCLRMGLLPASMLAGVGVAEVGAGIGVRTSFSVPIRIGEISGGELNTTIQTRERLREQVQSVVHALRLFKEGQIALAGFVTFPEQWLGGGTQMSSIGTSGATLMGSNYELNAKEASEFQLFWDELRASTKKQFIEAAIRRFGYAGERHRPEDRLVDLLIAAESLFLTGENLELSYRLSMRFALFVEESGYSRRELFDHMKRAYGVRSSIVHGGTLREKTLVLPKIGKVKLQNFVEETNRLLRLSLKKAIRMAATSDPAFGQWEQPIFG
jgi:hypothetical protein